MVRIGGVSRFLILLVTSLSALADQKATTTANQQDPCRETLQSEAAQSPRDVFVGHRVLLDSNTIINDPDILDRFVDSEVIIPGIVFEELDNINHRRDRDPNVAYAIRRFFRYVDRLPNKENVFQLENGSVLRFEMEAPRNVLPNTLDPQKPDNMILAFAYEMMKTSTKPFVLLTGDRQMSLKARSLGIPVSRFDRSHAAEILPSVLSIELSKAELQQFHEAGELPFAHPKATQNQFLWLKEKGDTSNSMGTLARFETGQYLPTRFDHGDDVASVMTSRHEGKIIPLKYLHDRYHGFIKPRNPEQRMALELIFDPSVRVVFLEGKAGTGRTILGTFGALAQSYFDENNPVYEHMLISRSAINMGGETHGFLPGGVEDKTDHFFTPYYDNLYEIAQIMSANPKLKVQNLADRFTKDPPQRNQRSAKSSGRQSTRFQKPTRASSQTQSESPASRIMSFLQDPLSIFEGGKDAIVKKQILAFTRGRTLPNTIWVIDEAQNLTPGQIDTILTRLGRGSKVILLADTTQIDPPMTADTSGFRQIMESYRGNIVAGHVKLLFSERDPLTEVTSHVVVERIRRLRQR